MFHHDKKTAYAITGNPSEDMVHRYTINAIGQEIVIPADPGVYCFYLVCDGYQKSILAVRILEEIYGRDISDSVITIEDVVLIDRARALVKLLKEKGNIVAEIYGNRARLAE